VLKKTILVLAFVLQFASIIGQGMAYVPEPGCFPCPEDPPQQQR